MTLYSIHFTGYYPVGAVAVVWADSRDEAIAKFVAHLKIHHPQLYKFNNNQPSDLIEQIAELEPTEPVNILLDGEY